MRFHPPNLPSKPLAALGRHRQLGGQFLLILCQPRRQLFPQLALKGLPLCEGPGHAGHGSAGGKGWAAPRKPLRRGPGWRGSESTGQALDRSW
jgi:hypothetical protein